MYGQLLQEIRNLNTRVEFLEQELLSKGKLKKHNIPDNVKIKPPWEREGINKKEWLKKEKSLRRS